jgi:hypothetical protein
MGREGTKENDHNLSLKNKTQSGSLRGKGTNHVPQAPLVTRSISGEKKMKNLKE